jgi:putative restriction endonuclease
MNYELRIRLAAFQWLDDQVKLYPDVIPRKILQNGFEFNGHHIYLMGPQGIFKPKCFKLIPISITTAPNGPYKDAFSDDGFLTYKYRGNDPMHRENVGLRQAMIEQIPLIYFHGIIPGRYIAIWPVFIIGDSPETLTFTVAADTRDSIQETVNRSKTRSSVMEQNDIQRRYITSTVRHRLHQSTFRERVLNAYRSQCSLCKLKHRELLDAAHIIPDSDEKGEPIVSNGLSLCKIHHSAYDQFFIGISPDYEIIVRKDILDEKDGPMLKHGLQEMHGRKIILPRNNIDKPNRENLAIKFDEFMNK